MRVTSFKKKINQSALVILSLKKNLAELNKRKLIRTHEMVHEGVLQLRLVNSNSFFI